MLVLVVVVVVVVVVAVVVVVMLCVCVCVCFGPALVNSFVDARCGLFACRGVGLSAGGALVRFKG